MFEQQYIIAICEIEFRVRSANEHDRVVKAYYTGFLLPISQWSLSIGD